jgi:hypothetical protein
VGSRDVEVHQQLKTGSYRARPAPPRRGAQPAPRPR